MATSTATEPDSEKNTRSRSPGNNAASRRASVSACSCTSPPNITCGISASCRSTRLADMRMVIAVAGGPPGRDAVDQLAAVGQRDAAAVGAHHRQRRSHGLHLRIRQPDMVKPGAVPWRRGLVPSARLPFSASNPGRLPPFSLAGKGDMRSLDRFRREKLGELDRASLHRMLAETDREDGLWIAAQRPAAAVLLLQRLPQPDAPSRGQEGRRRCARDAMALGCGASRLVTGNHPLFAELEAPPGAAEGHRSRLRVRLRLSRQCRHHSRAVGQRRPRADRRAGACLPVGGRAACTRQGRHLPPLRRGACRRNCWTNIAARHPHVADRHRRRLLHGRRPRAAAGACGAGAAPRRLADVRRCAWHRRGRRRARLELRPRRQDGHSAADGHAVEGDRRLWRLSLRLAPR